MARLLLDQLTPGMVLIEPLKNANGSVMLPTGSPINEKHIRAMKMWGILDVAVQSDQETNSTAPASTTDPALTQLAKEELTKYFSLTDMTDPIMVEIFNQAVMHYGRSTSTTNQ